MTTFSTETTTLDFQMPNTWGSGLVAEFVLTTSQSVNGWTMAFDYSGDIVNIWNARILSRIGTRYVIEGLSYNSNIAAGGSINFGFQGSGSEHDIAPVSVIGETIEGPDDPTSLPEVLVSGASAFEEDGSLSFEITLSDETDTDVTVSYQTVAGTALAGSDFTAVTGDVVILAGQTSASVTVTLTDDSLVEATENFTLELIAAEGAEIGTATATGSILDGDEDTTPAEPPVVSLTDASVIEGTPGTGTVATGQLIAAGPLSTSGNQIIDSNGDAVQIRAVNWFGAENSVRAPHGLWQRSMVDMMDQMVAEGFNAIRLPFSVQNILENQVATAVGGDPTLAGLTTLEIFDRIVSYADDIGMKVILDAHRITQGDGAEGIWYSGAYDEADWLAAWELLANRYGDAPAVIGADLLNEPHLGSWGTGDRNDWPAAAEIAGNAVLDIAPEWLILVEGIGSYAGDSYWWGGQLQGVRDRPVVLSAEDKLVYSPHDYPASIYQQPWFTDGSNLYDVFRENWGYIYEEGIAPILLGEFGSRLEDPLDLVWAEAITSYLSGDFDGDGLSDLEAGEAGPSFAWWSWNPNSGDTGGYVLDDWETVRENAADLLAPLLEGVETSSEGDASLLVFDVSLEAPATELVSYQYETQDGSAVAGEDYVATSGTVTFEVGEQTAQITVEVIPDALEEAAESLTLVLFDLDGEEVTATGTIVNDDVTTAEPITVMVHPGSVTEADPGAAGAQDDGVRYINFMVMLEAAATEQVTISYATQDVTAVSDSTNPESYDYFASSGERIFAVGEEMKTVSVAVSPDTQVEDIETFTFAVSGENLTGTLSATGYIYDNDSDGGSDGGDGSDGSGDTGGGFVGGGTTYYVGDTSVVSDFDPTTDILDLGGNSIHNQIPVDTDEGFMMLHMFDASKSLLLEGVYLADLTAENFAPISDGHLQQDLSAVLAYENGSGLVRDNTIYVRSHEEGLVETVEFDPATDKISFFYLSVRGDGQLNFAVEDTAAGARFYNPLTGQSLTLNGVSFAELDSSHFEWRANQLEDNLAGRMGLSDVIDGFEYVSENIFSGKSVAMAGGVDRAPYHSQPDYTGTPISELGGDTDSGDSGSGDGGGDGTDTETGDGGGGTGNDDGGTYEGDGSDALDASLIVSNDWGSGATVLLQISNVDTFNFSGGWTVEVALDPSVISGSWNSDWSENEDGSGIIVSDIGWNGAIAAGQAVEVGFQFNQGGLDQTALNQEAEFLFL